MSTPLGAGFFCYADTSANKFGVHADNTANLHKKQGCGTQTLRAYIVGVLI